MKRFCANDVILSISELFYLPILRVSVLEKVTRLCHRLVYPFLSQANCSVLSSGGIWNRCFAVLCCGSLLTIRILQLREGKKNSCQYPRSQGLSSYRPSLAPGQEAGSTETLGTRLSCQFIHEVPSLFFSTKLILHEKKTSRYSETKVEKHLRISNKPKIRKDDYHSGRLKQKQTIGKSLAVFL